MSDKDEIFVARVRFHNAFFVSLLKNWDKVNPNAGADPATWDQGKIMAFANKYTNQLPEAALKQFALTEKTGPLENYFKNREFLTHAAEQYRSLIMDALPVAPHGGPGEGFSRAAGEYAPEKNVAPAAPDETPAAPVVASPAPVAKEEQPAATAPSAAPFEKTNPTTDEIIKRLKRLAATIESPEKVEPPVTGSSQAPGAPIASTRPTDTRTTDAPPGDTGGDGARIDPDDFPLPPPPPPGLDGLDDFDKAPPPPDPELQQQDEPPAPPPVDWSAIPHILRTTEEDMTQVDAAHEVGQAALGRPHVNIIQHKLLSRAFSAKALESALPFTAESAGYLAVRHPGYDRDPLFLEALQSLALNKGVTVAELLDAPEMTVDIAGEEKTVDTRQAVFELYRSTSLLHTPPYDGFSREITGYGIVTSRWYEELLKSAPGIRAPEAPVQYRAGSVMFVDAAKNAYVDSGDKVTTVLAEKEVFDFEHAINLTRTYMAGRFDATGAAPQKIHFDLDGGDGPDGKNLSYMVIATLLECERANCGSHTAKMNHAIRFKTAQGMVPLHRILTKEQILAGAVAGPNDLVLNDAALHKMRATNANVDALLRNFNGVPDLADSPSISGPEPTERKQWDFTDVKSVADMPIGKLLEKLVRVDLTAQIENAAQFQAELCAVEELLRTDTASTPEHRQQFLQLCMVHPKEGFQRLLQIFDRNQIDAVLQNSKTAYLPGIDSFKGLDATSQTPGFAAILEETLVTAAKEKGASPAECDEMRELLNAAMMLQFAARITQKLAGEPTPDSWTPRGVSENKTVGMAGQVLTRLMQMDARKIPPAAIGKLLTKDIPQMVRMVQETMSTIDDPRTAELGAMFKNTLNDIARHYSMAASRHHGAGAPAVHI